MKISINGKFVKQISLRGDEPEFHYAFGVFETIRTYNGKPFELKPHLKRLQQSAQAIGLKLPVSLKKIEHYIQAHRSTKHAVRIKVIVTIGKIYVISEQLKVTIKTATLLLYKYKRNLPTVKSLSRIVEYQAHSLAQQRGCYDALFVDEHGVVSECAYANIFMVKRGKLYTPKECILAGITRNVIFKISKPIQKQLMLKDLLSADEVFITQTSTGILPVTKIGKHQFKVGAVTKNLQLKFQEYVEKH